MMMVTGADFARLPAESTATALTMYEPAGSAPVAHQVVPLQLDVEHGNVAKIFPPPQSSIRLSFTLSVARASTRMLLPVQTVESGDVIATAGSTVSVAPDVVGAVVPVEGVAVPVDGVVVPVVGVVVPVAVPVAGAPEANVGLAASLMIVTDADLARLPALSTATALTTYEPAASAPVLHQVVPLHVVVEQGKVAKIFPPPHSSIRLRPMLSVALAATRMLEPVQTVDVGEVIDTVGTTLSVPLLPELVVFDTFTVRDVCAVPPAESVTRAVNVTDPFGELAVFQLNALFVPVYTGAPPAVSAYT